MLHGGDQRPVTRDGIGQLDGKNGMVKAPRMGRSFGIYPAALGIDDHVIGIGPNLAQQGIEQSGFVLAIAVMMGHDIGSGMGLPATNPQLDGDVAHVMLYELGQKLHLLQLSISRRSESSSPLFDLAGWIQTAAGQVAIPDAHFAPGGKCLGSGLRRNKINHHLASQAAKRGHIFLFAQLLDVVDRPLPPAAG